MTYSEALNYIENTYLFGVNPSLDRIRNLLKLMGNPQDKLKFVHVAGTNGKGSTSNAIASVIEESGYKTGLYTSPYIMDFCERIKINGAMISEEELIFEVEKIMPLVEKSAKQGFKPTEFEVITAIAFDYFYNKNCDVVVLEVGLGGRYDATNIIKQSIVSVITTISYDHTQLLGNTLTEIAGEKSGIIKENGVVVCSPAQEPESLAVIMQNSAEKNSTLIIPNENAVKINKEDIGGTNITYGNFSFHIPLLGHHQVKNFLTAYEVLKIVRESGFSISDEQIKAGFSKVRFFARLEILHKKPLILLDGAHNPNGTAALADFINSVLKEKPTVIMGMLKDKDYKASVKSIASLAKTFVAVTPESPRALEASETAKTAADFCSDTLYESDYRKAFEAALRKSGGKTILICGSLYLAGRMRKEIIDYYNSESRNNTEKTF